MPRVFPIAAVALMALPLVGAPAQADYDQKLTPQEQQLYDGSGPGTQPKSLLNSTNPIELLNQLKRGSALNNATPPGDAVDKALREMEAQQAGSPGSAGVKGP